MKSPQELKADADAYNAAVDVFDAARDAAYLAARAVLIAHTHAAEQNKGETK